ncbi:hypothetical protein BDB00DRAFT_218334 [Zychaea mexicana]|uniref:uncharacterized protein n=1 Tax=Zychaea mexicana TaxID=64656 RepID=UPI0022FEF34E|nr:uncharacterized protein BDB00DRAFT_218334 [Zychaea mexicana]KAI9499110.1 hypothetical protein BDB00DRAFT_218334 [Zychaea mexicana]
MSIPNNYSNASLSHDCQGWLLISKLRKHLVWRASHSRYFCTLDGPQLRLYSGENDIRPKAILELQHYNVIASAPSQRGIVFNRTPSHKTFQLVSRDEEHRPDLILVAESKETLEDWVDHMTTNSRAAAKNNDVLEKWLERFDVNNKQSSSSESLPPSPSFSFTSSSSSLHKSPLSPLSPVQADWPASTLLASAGNNHTILPPPPPEKSISTLIQSIVARRKSSPALSSHRRRSSISPSSPTTAPTMTLQPIMDVAHSD